MISAGSQWCQLRDKSPWRGEGRSWGQETVARPLLSRPSGLRSLSPRPPVRRSPSCPSPLSLWSPAFCPPHEPPPSEHGGAFPGHVGAGQPRQAPRAAASRTARPPWLSPGTRPPLWLPEQAPTSDPPPACRDSPGQSEQSAPRPPTGPAAGFAKAPAHKSSPVWGKVVFATQDTSPYDVAVVKLEENLRGIPFPVLATHFHEGEDVCVVGFGAFGQACGPSVTLGILSAVVEVKDAPVMLQTTCAVHGGSSGGPLFSDLGELLGIVTSNTRDNSTGATYPHLNFSIPVTVLEPALEQYRQTGDLQRFGELDRPGEQDAASLCRPSATWDQGLVEWTPTPRHRPP